MIHAKDHDRLLKLDMTTYKGLIGQRLLIGTACVVAVAFISQMLGPDKAKSWAMKILEAWLYFLGFAVLGVNMGQYGLQRFSSKEYLGAKPPEAPPPAPAVRVDTGGGDANIAAQGASQAQPRPSQAGLPSVSETAEHQWRSGEPGAGLG